MRHISTKKYLFAFIITTFIFVIGILAGMTVEKARANKADLLNLEQQVAYSSLYLQESFLTSFGNSSCSAMDIILAENLNNLDKAMRKVTDYNKNSLTVTKELNLNLRNYFLTEIRYLMLYDRVRQLCNTSAVTILYFYGPDVANKQGYALDYMKKIFGEQLLIFSFDYDMKHQEPMIDVLIKTHNITEVPSLVVDGEKFSGFVNEDILYKELEAKLTVK